MSDIVGFYIDREGNRVAAGDDDAEIKKLEAEVAQAQAAAQAAEAERHRLRRARVLKEQLAEAQRQAQEERALAEAEAEYGLIDKAIKRIDTIDGMVIVRKPDAIVFKRFTELPESKLNATETRKLIKTGAPGGKPCVVYPAIDKFDAMIEDRPGILGEVALAVAALGGIKLREVGGK